MGAWTDFSMQHFLACCCKRGRSEVGGRACLGGVYGSFAGRAPQHPPSYLPRQAPSTRAFLIFHLPQTTIKSGHGQIFLIGQEKGQRDGQTYFVFAKAWQHFPIVLILLSGWSMRTSSNKGKSTQASSPFSQCGQTESKVNRGEQ